MNHVVEADKAGLPVRYSEPVWDVIYQEAQGRGRPFHDPMVGVREMFLLQPLARQVFFERFNYTLPNYGKINYSALFQTSQAVHFGLIMTGDAGRQLDFYDRTLGLLRARDEVEYNYEVKSGRVFFDLRPGERYAVTDFDDPRSSTEWREMRSGRLHVIRFTEPGLHEDCHELSRPGSLGLSLYTYRVKGLELCRERVRKAGAGDITDICANEFGESSFSFTAPDGYFWTLIED
jgi:catechol 2,3-dioxygenase-like lactoylglutathione lyase family enzyme